MIFQIRCILVSSVIPSTTVEIARRTKNLRKKTFCGLASKKEMLLPLVSLILRTLAIANKTLP